MGWIKITPIHRMLIAMDNMCRFLNLLGQDMSYHKPNFTTKDFKLDQYFSWMLKQIPKWMTLYDYQVYVWKKITNLDYYPRPNRKLLSFKKCNGKEKQS